ncbi:MAG: hypothetical protein JWM27_2907 [Gemmatimonadetes bacterium]|nr:hypothetical protein [Gemmatimonadota bacterium]
MYICYLDESGVPQKNAGTTPYFVLLGLAIPATSWKEKDAEIAEILNAHNFYGEVHTAWMARMYPEQERIPEFEALPGPQAVKLLAKNYAKKAAYVHLTLAERLASCARRRTGSARGPTP